jgi:transposase
MMRGMRALSYDLRQRIVDARKAGGLSLGQIARRYDVPRSTVQSVLEHYRDTGTIEPRPGNPGRRAAFEGQALRRLEQDVLAHPDATLEELRARCAVQTSLVTIHHTLKRLGFTRKKKRYERASRPGPRSPRDVKRG